MIHHGTFIKIGIFCIRVHAEQVTGQSEHIVGIQDSGPLRVSMYSLQAEAGEVLIPAIGS